MIGCVGKGAATSATTRQTRMSVLPWKGRTEFAGDEGVEGAEAGGEFGGGFSFLRVAFHAAGNQVAVGIAPRARLRHDVVQALDRRRNAAQKEKGQNRVKPQFYPRVSIPQLKRFASPIFTRPKPRQTP